MNELSEISIRRIHRCTDADIHGLSEVLVDCVNGGASVSFMAPLPIDRAESFWRGIASGVDNGDRALLVAEDAKGIVGTVQLVLAQPENQPHRADLAKMLVHRRQRKRGIGEALLHAIEDVARQCNRSLLVLDTASDDALRLYERVGWIRVGVIPDFALWPNGGFCPTTIYYKALV